MSGGETEGVSGGGVSAERNGTLEEGERFLPDVDDGDEGDEEEDGVKVRSAEDTKSEAAHQTPTRHPQ